MSYDVYFKKQAKELLKQFSNSSRNANIRISKQLNSTDDFGLMKSQHVIAKEAGFSSWTELTKASDEQLSFGKITQKYPELTSNGWSDSDSRISPYTKENRQELFNNYERIMKIANWIKENIAEPTNTRDYYYWHSGQAKDAMSRLFEYIDQDNYRYTDVGFFTMAALIAGFKPRDVSDYKVEPSPGSGRCIFAISKKSWDIACQKFPVLIK